MFLSKGHRDLRFAFQTHPGSQASDGGQSQGGQLGSRWAWLSWTCWVLGRCPRPPCAMPAQPLRGFTAPGSMLSLLKSHLVSSCTHASASGLLSNLPLLAQGLRTGCFLQSPHMSWLQCHFLREPSVDLLGLSAPHASFMTTVFYCTCDPFTSQAPTKHRLRESQRSIHFHILPCPPCLHSTGHLGIQ